MSASGRRPRHRRQPPGPPRRPRRPRPRRAPGRCPAWHPTTPTLVGGMTNHLEFARKVATLLLTYDAGTDFAARNADLLRAAAPTPVRQPDRTGRDVGRLHTDWCRPGFDQDHEHDGHGVAVRGGGVGLGGPQARGARGELGCLRDRHHRYPNDFHPQCRPTQVPVRMGLTVACPPAVEFCTLAGVFPQFVEDALGAG